MFRLTIRRLAAGTSLRSRHHQRYCNKRSEPFNPQSVRAMIERPQRSRRDGSSDSFRLLPLPEVKQPKKRLEILV